MHYIARQFAGPYARRAGLYLSPPFIKGAKQQGPQDADDPAVQYRKALAALDRYCRHEKGSAFASLSDADKDVDPAIAPADKAAIAAFAASAAAGISMPGAPQYSQLLDVLGVIESGVMSKATTIDAALKDGQARAEEIMNG